MEAQLDYFNKILLATFQINYMASSLNGSNQEMMMVKALVERKEGDGSIMANRIEQNFGTLKLALAGVVDVMEHLADYMNENDTVMPIDERISKPAFDILVHGKDEVERIYEEEV
jgi:hypothetical protein